ncbi:MAG: FumA C-terminus/TtdB family hydratase beta subunit [Candidatus Cloacimonadaceae bacterium]|nr:FumA C-terminus/TtdB family hydratase beta subunit [Candidatus Cloacimonadaceae bacterium]MDP3114589.1 FumA C-terminus/TtdB family hydratase beta subunit [Candidatus Cloacimonadaceae bacterium]
MYEYHLSLPFDRHLTDLIKPRDKIYLSGFIYTARDKAHQRLIDIIDKGEPLPFDLSDTAIFYCGPSPTPPGKICGVIGPTTSARMDKYTIPLLEKGLKVMIGKGERSREVQNSIHEHGALYLICVGGAAALLSKCIVSCETFLWAELGTEAVYRMQVLDLPCYVAIV